MSEKDTVLVPMEIAWSDAILVMVRFLDDIDGLPADVTDQQLVNLQMLIGNARARLLEAKRG